MAVRIESQAEPIPGYRLIERLGGGGFGEVWKAEAPGGLFKAIKFVYGDLGAKNDEDDSRADQEFKALNRVKSVHHPFILSLERIDVIEGQLIIVMELADRTIWDRFRECRQQGLPGIPREELLGYLTETAEALDLMNAQYQLQHLDIKPQNLFLVFNHIKVADFGLVKDLEGRAATVTGGVTPVYAAPETFDGWVSRFSDQYSLAIVYQELLTGQRPFSGTTIRQLVLQHLQRAPDLSSLLVAERPIVGRALSKNFEHRFPTCAEFMQTLRAAVVSHGNVVPALPARSAPEVNAGEDGLESRLVRPADEGTSAVSAAGNELPTQNARSPSVPRLPPEQRRLEPPPISVLPERPRKENTPGKQQTAGAAAVDTASPKLAVQSTPPKTPVPENRAGGVLQPALVIGLGRMGLSALKQLRRQISDQFDGHHLPHIRLLFIDTDPEAVHLAGQGKTDGLRPSEVYLARLQRPGHYLKTHEHEAWLDSRVLYRIPRSRNYAGVRPLGRLAFVDSYRPIAQRLEAAVTDLAAPESLQAAREQTGLEARNLVPRVYIVASLTGGTGGGMFLDVAYLARRLLREQGHERVEICGVFFVPHAGAETPLGMPLANAYAAFTELTHFSARDTVFTFRYEHGKPIGQDAAAPFEYCNLFALPQMRQGAAASSPEETLAKAGRLLFDELLTPVGTALDNARCRADCAAPFGDHVGFHNFGTYRILWPRRQILLQAAHRLCARLVLHWMSKDAAALKEEIRTWAVEQWEAQGFRPENLIAQVQERCERVLGQAAEKMFQAIIEPVARVLAGRPGDGAVVQMAPALEAADSLEKLLGIPEECRTQGPGPAESEACPVEKAVQESVREMAGQYEHILSELVVRLFEEPAFRLAGAEELMRQLGGCVQKALETQESLCRELEERTLTTYERLRVLLEGGPPVTTQTTPRWKAAFTRRPAANGHPGAELVEVLRTYAKCRYQSLVLQYVNGLYVRLRGFLSDQMREVGFCRTRLSELAGMISTRLSAVDAGPVADEILLPPGCANVDAVAKQIDAGLDIEDLLGFDKEAQALVVKQYHGLVNVCMATSTVIAALMPALVHEAEVFLEPRVTGADVAGLYLARYPEGAQGDTRLDEDLRSAYYKAAPGLTSVPPERELCIIAVPEGESGKRLQRLAGSLFPQARLVTSNCADELVIFRGCQRLDPTDTDQFGDVGQEAYRLRSAQDPLALHSRTDVETWHSGSEVLT